MKIPAREIENRALYAITNARRAARADGSDAETVKTIETAANAARAAGDYATAKRNLKRAEITARKLCARNARKY